MPAEKERIGRLAALIEDGETIFIGSGSTTLEVARNLIGRKNPYRDHQRPDGDQCVGPTG